MSNDSVVAIYQDKVTAGIFALSQKKQSVLAPVCKNMAEKGRVVLFDQISPFGGMIEITSRGASTGSQEYTLGRAALFNRKWSTQAIEFDSLDAMKVLNDPTNIFVEQLHAQMQRQKDIIIRQSFDADVLAGEFATDSPYVLASGQKIVVTFDDGSTHTGLTINKLLKAQQTNAENFKDGLRKFLIMSPKQQRNLLANTNIQNSLYTGVHAMITGQVPSLLGMDIIVDPTAPSVDSNSDEKVFVLCEGAIIYNEPDPMIARIDEDFNRNHIWKLVGYMTGAAIRRDPTGVIVIACDPTVL